MWGMGREGKGMTPGLLVRAAHRWGQCGGEHGRGFKLRAWCRQSRFDKPI